MKLLLVSLCITFALCANLPSLQYKKDVEDLIEYIKNKDLDVHGTRGNEKPIPVPYFQEVDELIEGAKDQDLDVDSMRGNEKPIPLPYLQERDSCLCGGPFSSNRIVGGAEVKPHSIPFQVGLTFRPAGVSPFCGGTLISPNYVLTAAHCSAGKQPSDIRVFVGDHNWSLNGDGEQYINVESILIHPQYAPGVSTLWANDYSILRLAIPVTLSATAGLACLPPDASQTFENAQLVNSGWGRIGSSQPLSPVLKAANMIGISSTGCQNVYGPAIGSYHLCANGAPTNSSCNGDSGGPLTALVNGRVTVVGVTSFGVDDCSPVYPSAFARVTYQKDWILANTDAKSYQCNRPVVTTLTFDGFWGDWSLPLTCPSCSNWKSNFVVGFKTRVEPGQGRGDDTAMNGIIMTCAIEGGPLQFDGIWGNWDPNMRTCAGGFNGAMIKLEPRQGRGDDTAMNGIRLFCPSTNAWIEGLSGPWGGWSAPQFCPTGQRIFGVSVRFEGRQGRGDDTAMNGVKILCR